MKDVCFVLAGLAMGCGAVSPGGTGGDDDTNPVAAPVDVVATANLDHGVRLAWTPPPGADASTTYAVTASPADGTAQITDTRAVVTGLTAGTAYTFTVTASTAAGTSPESEPSPEVTAVVGPDAPAGFVACGANNQVTLRADATAATAFHVYSDASVDPSLLTAEPQQSPTLPIVLPGLSNDVPRRYIVTALDASGIESLPTAVDTATPSAQLHDTIFVSSYSADTFIEAVDCFSKYSTGQTPAGRQIGGTNVGIIATNYNELAVDPAHAILYYRNPSSILAFADATLATGNVAPTRIITSSALTGGRGIALDTTRDILYVNNSTQILVFANVSTLSGNLTPTRTIQIAAPDSPSGLALDTTNDRLYLANYSNVLVFNNASTLTGTAAASRTISISGQTLSSFGVSLDTAANLLYISSRDTGMVHTVLATAAGAVTPIRTVTGLDTPMGNGIFNNHLMTVSDNSHSTVQVWNNASAVTGATTPDETITIPSIHFESGFAYSP